MKCSYYPASNFNRPKTAKRCRAKYALIISLFLLATTLGSYYAVNVGFSLPEEGHAWSEDASAISQEAAQLFAQHTIHQNYTVCLKPNDSFANLCQPDDRQYLTLLTDKINLDFGYKFTTDTKLDYNYTYKITGKLIVYDKDFKSKEILVRNYDLLDSKFGGKQSTETIDIAQSYELDFQYFNREAIVFKDENALSGEATLFVQMEIDLDAKHGSREISRAVNLDFSIPLTKQTYHISIGSQPDKDDLLEFAVIESRPFWTKKQCWIIVGASIGLIIIVALLKRHFAARKSPHERYHAKIHKEYGRIIVDIDTPLKIDGYKHRYHVNSFEDLVNKADRTMQNILCFAAPGSHVFYAITEGDNLFLHECSPQRNNHSRGAPPCDE